MKLGTVKIFTIAILLNSTLSCCQVDRLSLRGTDFRLFNYSPNHIEELAQAVANEQTGEIERLIKDHHLIIDFEEPVYAQTLLHLAVSNELVNSTRKLLELGANPNHIQRYNGTTPAHDAVTYRFKRGDDTTILKLLKTYGADFNLTGLSSKRDDQYKDKRSKPVLAEAANEVLSFNKKKFLIDNGADINYSDSSGHIIIFGCLVSEDYKTLLYLLNTNKLNYAEPIYTGIYTDFKKRYILEEMRESFVELGSEEHKYKLLVIDYLKKQGLDYKKEPITESAIKYAKEHYEDTWQTYLDKY